MIFESHTLPFSLLIFVADVDFDDLRIVDKSNSTSKAPVFRRAQLPPITVLSSEFHAPT